MEPWHSPQRWSDDDDPWAGWDPTPSPSPLRSMGRFVRELMVTAVQAGILAFLIIYFVAQATVVHGQSMEPTLHTDQRLIIEKVSYHFYIPQRSDVVVIDVTDSDLPLIKRVIGLPGEIIEVRSNQVYINGQLLDEPYLHSFAQPDFAPVRIPDGQVFVMGDNRFDSRDSRAFGPIPVDQILGRAWVSYWPVEDIGFVH